MGGFEGSSPDQKAAAGAAEEAREGRRVSDALRDAAVGAGTPQRSPTPTNATPNARSANVTASRSRRCAIASVSAARAWRARAARGRGADVDRRWRDLYRELTGESGAWAAAADPTPTRLPRTGGNSIRSRTARSAVCDSSAITSTSSTGTNAGGTPGRRTSSTGGDSDAGAARIAEALGAIKLSGGDVADDDDEAASRAEAESEAAQAAQAAQAEADREAVELSREDRGKVLLSVPRRSSTPNAVGGRVDVSRAWVHFVADKDDEHASGGGTSVDTNAGELPRSKKRFWRWSTTRVDEVHHARYRLQHVAVEIFLSDRTSAFLAFADRKTARDAAARIAACKPGITLMDRRRKLEAAARAQERWRRRELSTFDYRHGAQHPRRANEE